MQFKIHPQKDVPISNAELLGHDKVVFHLKSFLESEHMIAPLSISLQGEWGTGKSSILKTLEKLLDDSKFETLFFETWKYEYTNPALGLISEIASRYAKNDKIIGLIRGAVFIFSQKYLGTTPDDIAKYMSTSSSASQTYSDKLRETINQALDTKKLIVMIDDLDRCNVENTLQLLVLLKLFLDLDNCICLVAVDYKRLKQAWRQKYQIKSDDKEDGSNYLDKIFQINLTVPKPSSAQIKEYVQTLLDIPSEIAEMFAAILNNPRSIKKIINLISYRANLLNSAHRELSVILWTLFEEIISAKSTIAFYQGSHNGSQSLGKLIVNYSDWSEIARLQGIKPYLISHDNQLNSFFTLAHKFILQQEVSADALDNDFKILYHP